MHLRTVITSWLAMFRAGLFLFLFMGCQKYSHFEESGGRMSIVGEVPLHIEMVEVLPWKARKGSDTDISRGVLVKFVIPHLRDEHIEEMFNKRGVDSWLVKVSRRNQNYTMEDVGYFYVPNFVKRGREQKFYPRNFSHAFFQVLYTATLMNQRMMDLHCPSMGHARHIPLTQWYPSIKEVKEEKGLNSPVWVLVPSERIMSRVQKVELIPVAFDGGNSLIGEYFIDLALYNTKEGRRYSDYARVGNFSVDKELERASPNCVPTDHRKNPVKGNGGFRFGK